MPVSFPSLSQIFGFGMPYTLLTRTPFSDCMLFIGVPPKDIFEHILSYDPQKLNYLDRKRAEINGILTDPTALSRIVNEKAASGEFDLQTIGKALLAADADVTQFSKESLEALAHTHMCERLRTWYTDWRPTACRTRLQVNGTREPWILRRVRLGEALEKSPLLAHTCGSFARW